MSQRKPFFPQANAAQGNSAKTKVQSKRAPGSAREDPVVLTVLNPHAAGIDVHSDMHMVCASPPTMSRPLEWTPPTDCQSTSAASLAIPATCRPSPPG
jgi:hypothetical protein